jgi:hypothetical protein
MIVVFKVGNRIPDNSILRRGTLLIGVPRQEKQQVDSDPMQPAIDQIEKALYSAVTGQLTERFGPEPESAQSESTTRKPNENA